MARAAAGDYGGDGIEAVVPPLVSRPPSLAPSAAQTALLSDGLVVAASGITLLAAARPVARVLGLGRRALRPAGLGFILYGLGLTYRVLRHGPSRPLLAGIATLNTGWVGASLLALVAARTRLSRPARALISLTAAIVAAFAGVQWWLWGRGSE
jgi:hypothetical protein